MHKNARFNIVQAPENCSPLFNVIEGQRTDSGHMAPGAIILSAAPMPRSEAIQLADKLQAEADAGQVYNVTFENPLSGTRGMLIEGVTATQADAVVERFSDQANTLEYLPGVRKEPAA